MNQFQLDLITDLKNKLCEITYCKFDSYLFGSIARGDYTAKSDIDVLIVVENGINKKW